MVHLSIFGIIGGAVLVILGLLMGYAVFPPVVNTKVKEVSRETFIKDSTTTKTIKFVITFIHYYY